MLVFGLGLEIEKLLGAALDTNSNGYVEAAELGVYYGFAPPSCEPPRKVLGIPIGGPRCQKL